MQLIQTQVSNREMSKSMEGKVFLCVWIYSPAAKLRFGALPCFEVLSFFLMDSVSVGIADDQTENWNFVSVEQFKI